MAKKAKDRLPLEKCKKLGDLDYDHLIEHAGNTSEKAVDFLETLLETIPYTKEELKEKRHLLDTAITFKYVKDENGEYKTTDTGSKIIAKDANGVEIGKSSYTQKQIEKMMEEYKEIGKPKYSPAEVKKLYCTEFWQEMLGEQKSSQKQRVEERKSKLAEARERAKAKNK